MLHYKKHKCKCEICKQNSAKYICKVKGENYNKAVCQKCFDDLLSVDKNFVQEVEKYNSKVKNSIDFITLICAFFVLFGTLIYCRVLTDYKDIGKLFQDNGMVIYFIIFSAINYVIGYLVNYSTQNMPIWCKIVFNIVFTILLTLLGCLTVIRDDIQWLSVENPLIFILPIMFVFIALLIILNRIKRVNKLKVRIFSYIVLLLTFSVAIVMIFLSLY